MHTALFDGNEDKLHAVASAIKHLFHDPETPFWTGRVMDLLFDGIDIDCRNVYEGFDHYTDRSGLLFAAQFSKYIKVINREHLKFSMMGEVSRFEFVFGCCKRVKIVIHLRLTALRWVPSECVAVSGTTTTWVVCTLSIKRETTGQVSSAVITLRAQIRQFFRHGWNPRTGCGRSSPAYV